MDPRIAAVIFAFGILGLFLLDRDPEVQTSKALWIPVVWLSISSSRMVSQWLGGSIVESADQLVEGNPLDARFYAALLAAGLIVLVARRQLVKTFLKANWPILIFLAYCALSIWWSDYPLVAFKRWTKALGDLAMILIVLSDDEPVAALKRVLARSGFVLIPLSILFIKYYPAMARAYSPWNGTAYNTGVATGKNGLGIICLVFGLASVWRLLEAVRSEEGTRRVRSIIVHGTVIAQALWLFHMADSATSLVCFLIGSILIGITSLRTFVQRPAAVHLLVAAMLLVAVYGTLLNPSAGLTDMVGRDATLTGRTALWDERLEAIWRINWWHPLQAHNGYIEIFLDLGWVGLALLGLMMACGYRNVFRLLGEESEVANLRLAYLVVAAAFNLTEFAFKEIHPVWIVFLLAVIAVPEVSVPPGDGDPELDEPQERPESDVAEALPV
jgi:exopolysaccharide production protein ExoQ